ncbi:MAG: 2-amino-4-hydroxy-6-hydroxymethyldihydropteridine diphosphokinase [Candidatus Omnitrophota bacterium]
MTVCYIGIGSNLGKRRQNLRIAVKEISRFKDTEIIKISKIRETKPIAGSVNQPKFINAVLKIKTYLPSLTLLKNLQKIEVKLGRPKIHLRWGPRVIDLDILFYGNRVIKTKVLVVPHPRIFERDFVMQPLLEVI